MLLPCLPFRENYPNDPVQHATCLPKHLQQHACSCHAAASSTHLLPYGIHFLPQRCLASPSPAFAYFLLPHPLPCLLPAGFQPHLMAAALSLLSLLSLMPPVLCTPLYIMQHTFQQAISISRQHVCWQQRRSCLASVCGCLL